MTGTQSHTAVVTVNLLVVTVNLLSISLTPYNQNQPPSNIRFSRYQTILGLHTNIALTCARYEHFVYRTSLVATVYNSYYRINHIISIQDTLNSVGVFSRL